VFYGRPGDAYARIKHAPNVNETIFEIVGNLVMTADNDSIEVGQRTGTNGIVHDVNQIWFTVQGRDYALIYNGSNTGQVEIRARNKHGGVVIAFDNATKASIQAAFAGL
jgi:hypothetical protein